MAIRPCRECGKDISTEAKTCPHCGVGKPYAPPPFRLRPKHVAFGLIGLVVVTMLGTLIEPQNDAPRTERDRKPGVTRVGEPKAAQLWADVASTPGVQRWSCGGGLCSVMFEPSLWRQMDFDLKRDFTASMGIAFSHGKSADWTSIRDRMTNQELASYSTMHDKVDIK